MGARKCVRCHRKAVRLGYCEVHSKSAVYRPPRAATHRPPRRTDSDWKERMQRWELYGDEKWRELSKRFLRDNPWCVRCERRPRHLGGPKRVMAAHADHVLPLKLFPEYRYELDMVQPLCLRCHSSKSRYEQTGRFYDYRTGKCFVLDPVAETS